MQFLGYGDWLSVRPDGPLWFRGYDQWTDEEGAAQIGKVLEAYDAAHIAVGHTVQKGGRIRPRFGDKVFLIDTGMLSSYYPGGRAQLWKSAAIRKFTAEYMDQQVVLIDPALQPGKAAVPRLLPELKMRPRFRTNLPLRRRRRHLSGNGGPSTIGAVARKSLGR